MPFALGQKLATVCEIHSCYKLIRRKKKKKIVASQLTLAESRKQKFPSKQKREKSQHARNGGGGSKGRAEKFTREERTFFSSLSLPAHTHPTPANQQQPPDFICQQALKKLGQSWRRQPLQQPNTILVQ